MMTFGGLFSGIGEMKEGDAVLTFGSLFSGIGGF